MATFFSDHFRIDPAILEAYGAFDVSLITDLPLFIDPFLLFTSKKSEYRELHNEIIRYLVFLRDKSAAGQVGEDLLRAWYCFPEVRQTWLGFTELGNDGRGLGIDFAQALHGSLHAIFQDFGEERITKGSHLEKVCLIKDGVGRDNISDFTTNLIKRFLLEYTERFAKTYLRSDQYRRVAVRDAAFDYVTETWVAQEFTLPGINRDFVVLTPKDMLTRDDNWINRSDLLRDFDEIPPAIPDKQLRALVNNYFARALASHPKREPTLKERLEAAARTVKQFPAVIDYFIRSKEDRGEKAKAVSAEKVRLSQAIFNAQITALQGLLSEGEFYKLHRATYEETHQRIAFFKDVVEKQDGYRLLYKDGKPISHEKDLQIMFRLVWFGTPSDVSSEANDGRGPADFKISRGARIRRS